MSTYRLLGTIADTSPASASTAVSAIAVSGLEQYQEIHIEADLLGATGGTLDVYLQRRLGNDLWRDWIHFSQLADGAAAVKYSAPPGYSQTMTVVGGGTTAAPGVAIAANTNIGCHPGTEIRAVYVAGAGTSVGAAQTVRVFGLQAL